MDGMKPYAVAVLIQAMFAGMVLVSKAAFNVGMSTSVFVFYRQFAGTLFILPFGIIFERKSLHQLSLATFCKIFMLAFLGITVSLNVYGLALVDFLNICSDDRRQHATHPSLHSQACSACQAPFSHLLWLMAIAFERDPQAWKLTWNIRLLSILYCVRKQALALQTCCCFFNSPTVLDSSRIVKQGIVVTGLTYYLQAWVVAKKGPVFLAMTMPLNLIMTILGSMFLLGEVVYLGR
ncbi:hypothetical protein GQ457_04G008330 [Hibiscus cannabinus]